MNEPNNIGRGMVKSIIGTTKCNELELCWSIMKAVDFIVTAARKYAVPDDFINFTISDMRIDLMSSVSSLKNSVGLVIPVDNMYDDGSSERTYMGFAGVQNTKIDDIIGYNTSKKDDSLFKSSEKIIKYAEQMRCGQFIEESKLELEELTDNQIAHLWDKCCGWICCELFSQITAFQPVSQVRNTLLANDLAIVIHNVQKILEATANAYHCLFLRNYSLDELRNESFHMCNMLQLLANDIMELYEIDDELGGSLYVEIGMCSTAPSVAMAGMPEYCFVPIINKITIIGRGK